MSVIFDPSRDGAGLKVAVVGTRWNPDVVDPMVTAAISTLKEKGVSAGDIDQATVPGAYELPLVSQQLAKSGKYDLILSFGCVIRGETAHFDYVAGEAARGLTNASLETGVPIMFGVLTTENREQAYERALPDRKNKGAEIAADAIAYVSVLTSIKES